MDYIAVVETSLKVLDYAIQGIGILSAGSLVAVKFIPNPILERLLFKFFKWVDRKGTTKFGKDWGPVENSIIGFLKLLSRVSKKAMKD